MNDRPVRPAIVCVQRLDPSWSERWVKEKFSEFGTIVNINMPVHPNGRRKGFAFVQYATTEEAHLSVSSMSIFFLF
jgi:RNA recognition motif-containing protein